VFRRDASSPAPSSREEDAEPGRPRMTQQDLNEHRGRALERKLNTPSTFATRRRGAQAVPPDRELVSMGTTEQVVTQGMHEPEHSVVQVELFFDRRHPSRLYYRTPGGVLLACSETAGKEDTVVTHRPIAVRPRLAGAHEPSPPDPPARPI